MKTAFLMYLVIAAPISVVLWSTCVLSGYKSRQGEARA